MFYDIVDHIHKMKVMFPIMEVMKIPQQKENLIKILEDEFQKEN